MRSSPPDHMDEPRRYALLGQWVAVAASDAAAPWCDRLDSLLAGFHEPARARDRAARFGVRPGVDGALWQIEGGNVSTPAWSDNALLRELEWRVVAAAARHAALPLLLHAGAVARDGLALLFPADSGSGKTSLTLALAARGWLPLTDDICPLELAGDCWYALPCQRCCHLDAHMVELLVSQGIALEGPVANLAGYYRPTRWAGRARVSAIAVPHFASEAAPRRTRMSQAECLAALISATYEQARQSRSKQRLLARQLATQAPAFRLTYASLDDAFSLVEGLMDELALGVAPPAAPRPVASVAYPA